MYLWLLVCVHGCKYMSQSQSPIPNYRPRLAAHRLTTRLTSFRSFSVISVFLGLDSCDMTDTMSCPPVGGVVGVVGWMY